MCSPWWPALRWTVRLSLCISRTLSSRSSWAWVRDPNAKSPVSDGGRLLTVVGVGNILEAASQTVRSGLGRLLVAALRLSPLGRLQGQVRGTRSLSPDRERRRNDG